MITRHFNVFALGALAAVAVASETEAAWQYCQPWNQQRDSHISRVRSCGDPSPLPATSWDDWVADEDARIRLVTWWGVLTNSDAQENDFRFHIAIANHDELNCLPNTVIYERCVLPNREYVGSDCANMPVYRFWAVLPGAPFEQAAGEHYWLSIAEDEESSPRQGDDFRWSGHRAPNYCFAAQLQSDGTYFQPLVSACDQRENDLAFCLRGRVMTGALTMDPVPQSATIELHGPGGGVLEVLHIAPDEHGAWLALPEIADGDYLAVLRIPGALPVVRPVTLLDGEVANVMFGQVVTGDVDGDETIGFQDLLRVLSNWQ